MHERHHRPSLTATSVLCRTRPGLETLATTISAFIDPTERWTIELASERGDSRLLQRLIAPETTTTNPHYRSHVFSKAVVHAVRHADSHDLQLLEWLLAYCHTGFASKDIEEAARLGKVHILQWPVDNCSNLMWSPRYTDIAAFAGHLDTLVWLKEYAGVARQWCLAAAIQHAARAGHLNVVQWLHDNIDRRLINDQYERMALQNAIRGGHLNVVTYFHQ